MSGCSIDTTAEGSRIATSDRGQLSRCPAYSGEEIDSSICKCRSTIKRNAVPAHALPPDYASAERIHRFIQLLIITEHRHTRAIILVLTK
jgi:hypothetical protein